MIWIGRVLVSCGTECHSGKHGLIRCCSHDGKEAAMLIGFLIGCFGGRLLGVFTMALLVAGKVNPSLLFSWQGVERKKKPTVKDHKFEYCLLMT